MPANVIDGDRAEGADDHRVAVVVGDGQVVEPEPAAAEVDVVLSGMEVEDRVMAEMTFELEAVTAVAADETVVAATAVEDIGAGATIELVESSSAVEMIVAALPG